MSGQLIGLLAQIEDQQLRGDVTPYIVLFAFGFLMAIVGHLMQSRPLIIAGILIAATGSFLPFLRWG